jgi:hypothetical protein
MALGDLQAVLGSLVATRALATRSGADPSGWLRRWDLTAEERAWLDRLIGSPGLEVTCLIQRWWREMRLLWALRLTPAALGPDGSARMIEAYLNSSPCPSLFFNAEALGFLDFVIGEAPAVTHLDAVARFERALIQAAEAAPEAPRPVPAATGLRRARRITPHPAAAVIEFAAPSERVLGALLSGDPLPPPDGLAYPVLVAAGLPHLWRPATPAEARLFVCCCPSATPDRLLAVAGSERPLQELLGIAALCLDH